MSMSCEQHNPEAPAVRRSALIQAASSTRPWLRCLERMASLELEAACLLGIVDDVAKHAEPHVEHVPTIARKRQN